jgi:hypothetical protein
MLLNVQELLNSFGSAKTVRQNYMNLKEEFENKARGICYVNTDRAWWNRIFYAIL